MSPRSLVLGSLFAFAVASPLAHVAIAQEVTAPKVENSNYRIDGVINANSVLVRSGMGENFYPTLKLDKGAKVTIVGMKYDWFKIVPPDGSFCYVAKAYVEKRGDGTVGRVTKDAINVRAGSALNPVKITVLCQLRQGEDVQILGEQEEYFKIKPPENAFLYINKQFVDPDLAATPVRQTGAGATDIASVQSEPITTPSNNTQPTNTSLAERTASPSTQPASSQPSDQASVPATQPADAAAAAQSEFDTTELAFQAATAKPLLEQPIDTLQTSYMALSKNEALPESMHRIVDARLNTLATRATAQKDYQGVIKSQEALKSKQLALKAEQEELQAKLAASQVQVFTAVGTLQASSLQQGKATLYRLCDPASGRTVVYLRTNDPKILAMLGQFVGVKGDLATESQLTMRVITPTDVQPVDPAKVNSGVAAQILPASMMPRAAEASVGNQ